MAALEVLKPGLMSTIQDGGRFGYRKFGFPVSGYLDQYAAVQANYLVGNDINGPVIEMIHLGGTFRISQDLIIAITGADMQARTNGNPCAMYKYIKLSEGDVLDFGASKDGNVTYLAIQGVWQLKQVLGSASTFTRAKIGGHNDKPLQKGDLLTIKPTDSRCQTVPEHLIRKYPPGNSIRIIIGPDVNDALRQWISTTTFEISTQFDRMGMRINASAEYTGDVVEQISSPVLPGILQMPAKNTLIALLSDCQTTGGYPRIGKIIDYDIPYLVQQKPGSTVRFTYISSEEAEKINKNGLVLFRK